MIRRLLVTTLLALTGSLHGATRAESLIKKEDAWFHSDEGRTALDCIISWQSNAGDWPKNKDTTSEMYSGERSALKGTFDNGATTGELRVLARAFRLTKDVRYEKAFLTGFDHILKAQYSNGGFPQYFPLSKQYHRHITFNDSCMVRLMELLREAATSGDYAFLSKERRARALQALEGAIDCVVKCQITVNDRLTVWCAQHDAVTLAPANARSYELASLSGAESAGILVFLMSLEDPKPEVVRAVKAGVAWFESSIIEGYRYKKSATEPALTKDPAAPPLWARFYEIGSNRPFFSDRDGVVKYDIQEIGGERRRGYSWFSSAGEKVARAYAEWDQR